MTDVRIRPARPDERDELEALQRRASLALPDYRAQLEANPDAIHLPAEQIERGAVFIAETKAGIAGFAVLLIERDRAELDGLFVEPELWRQGVGKALIDEATHRARMHGLAIGVTAEPTARGFYERCGFWLEGETETRFGPALRMSR